MPRKDDGPKYKKSSNPRANIDTNGVSADFGFLGNHVNNLADLYGGKQSYSDFTSRFNGYTDGWYSTLANGLPFISGMHNALLGRDSAKDYLDNNGLTWEDMKGYNDMKLLGRSASGVGSMAHQSGTYLGNIGNDLGKLYSGQRPARITFDKQQYHSDYMDAW